MTSVRGVDNNNDWLFGKGKNDYKSNNNAVAQNIKTRLQSFLGDCFFDLNAGIDWFNLLGSKQQLSLKLSVSATILNTAEVKEIIEVSTSLSQDRTITLTYVALTSYGIVRGTLERGI